MVSRPSRNRLWPKLQRHAPHTSCSINSLLYFPRLQTSTLPCHDTASCVLFWMNRLRPLRSLRNPSIRKMSFYTTSSAASPFTQAVVSSMRKLYPESLADKSFDNTGRKRVSTYGPLISMLIICFSPPRSTLRSPSPTDEFSPPHRRPHPGRCNRSHREQTLLRRRIPPHHISWPQIPHPCRLSTVFSTPASTRGDQCVLPAHSGGCGSGWDDRLAL